MREIGHEMPKQDQSTFTVESGLTFPFWEIKLLSSSCHSNQSAVFSAQMVKMVGFPEPVISWGNYSLSWALGEGIFYRK